MARLAWLVVAAVCAYEAYSFIRGTDQESIKGYFFIAIGAYAIFRLVMIRRQQMRIKQDQ